jgi:hypothetical protein
MLESMVYKGNTNKIDNFVNPDLLDKIRFILLYDTNREMEDNLILNKALLNDYSKSY